MRIAITLEASGGLELPIHYSPTLQGFIYHQLEHTLAEWLHEHAYPLDKRRYKMFTFSRLTPADQRRYQIQNGTIYFPGPASFSLASVNHEVLRSLAETLLKTPKLQLGNNHCTLRGVEVLKKPTPDFTKPIRVRALSPITVYQTLTHPSGSKKTYYYSPHEREWHQLLRDNLVRKAKALEWQDNAQEALEHARVTPRNVTSKHQKILKYKGNVIKGWVGHYDITGVPEAYFELLYDAGLGSKNSQGFGMVEVVR